MQNLKAAITKFSDTVKANVIDTVQSQFNVLIEGCRELYSGYASKDDREILDGAVDVMWVGLSYAHVSGWADRFETVYQLLDDYKVTPSNPAMQEYYFNSFVENAKKIKEDPTSSEDLRWLLRNVILFIGTYKHDYIGAMEAVISENLSKCDFNPEMTAEVFRDNKLQKKDRDGKFYPWYKPAQFANYLRFANIFDMKNAVVLDTETTGLDDGAEVVQIAMIDTDSASEVVNEVIKPTKPIPAEATKIHGITNEAVAWCDNWAEIHDYICELLTGAGTVYIYNADYDTRIIKQTAKKYGLKVPEYKTVCVMKKYAQLWGELVEKNGRWQHPWTTLVKACEQQGINVSDLNAHDALSDCIMTLRLMEKLNSGEYNTYRPTND